MQNGAKVALKIQGTNEEWLSCESFNGNCGKGTCPGVNMDGDDWNRCSEQVFKMYNPYNDYHSTDSIHVGDQVLLRTVEPSFFTFSMSDESGHIEICGYFNDNGFNLGLCSDINFYTIYAKGRNFGDKIFEHDYIILEAAYYRQYIEYSSPATFSTCSTSADWGPPSEDIYDRCSEIVAELWLQ